jgi:hypothetical protein
MSTIEMTCQVRPRATDHQAELSERLRTEGIRCQQAEQESEP